MISVIIPVGPGRAELLDWTLWALQNQTVKPKEVIIGANTDDFLFLLDDYENLHIKVIIDKKQRVNCGAINRNNAVKLSRCDKLLFVDSEVALNPKAVEIYTQNFIDFEKRAIAGPYHFAPQADLIDVYTWDEFQARMERAFEQYPNAPRTQRDSRLKWEKYTARELYCAYPKSLCMFGGNFAIDKEIFERTGGFWEKLTSGEDGAFGIELCKQGAVWSFDKRTYGYHLWHPLGSHVNFKDTERKIIQRYHSDESWIGKMRRDWE